MTYRNPEPRTAVAGAGISGPTASKILTGFDCFDTSDRIYGGLTFGMPQGPSGADRSLHIDTSWDMLSFRTFRCTSL